MGKELAAYDNLVGNAISRRWKESTCDGIQYANMRRGGIDPP